MEKEDSKLNFVEMEKKILEFWKENGTFHKLVAKNKNGQRFKFLDGPITANNRCGVHHIWGRTLKDITLKYNALKGRDCQYQNGFDAQGMWVEVNVEKELGLNGKPEIVKYGIDNFTNKCMERVDYFANEITNQSIRMGQWMDWDNSYFTNTDGNILSIWHFLKKCSEQGLIVKKNRPMAWCPRCGTSLSEHEMSGSYHNVTHTAVFVKFPVKNKDFKMLAWTTTPWTLSANVALAVNSEFEYVKVLLKNSGEKLVLCKSNLKVVKEDYEILETFKGDTLVGLTYETCFPELKEQNFEHKILPWEEVDNVEGSGVVHIAPGCGAEDFELGKKFDLQEICPIDEQGVMLSNTGFLKGKKTTDVVELVIERLKKDGKLHYSHNYTHSYPYCWRCKTDLVYKLISTWYIAIDELRPKLLSSIEEVTFQPDYGKKRMADWLNNMGDWNISRSRFYGLPLPFYLCEKCGHLHVVGSVEELSKVAVNPEEISQIPHLHRPWIDNIKIKCPNCGETVERIKEVGDCWLDAGITPFSTKKYFEDKEFFKNNFPSEYVCEMVEQLKLWFYSMLVMSVVLEGRAPYTKVVTHQYVKDENGNEFHKSGGNSMDSDVVADKVGADPIRYLYGGASITNDMRFGLSLTAEARRKLMNFWNAYIFYNTYAILDNPDVENFKIDFKNLCQTDRWLIEKLNKFIKDSDVNYSEEKSFLVVKDFEEIVDEITNFYIRVNRKRFWKSDDKKDQMTAYACLYKAIKVLTQIMTPVIPFMTEHIWQNLVRQTEKNAEISVMLGGFPEVENEVENSQVVENVTLVREIIATALRLRNEKSLKIKQPLRTLFIVCDDKTENAVKNFEEIVKDELNVKEIDYEKNTNKFNVPYLSINFKTAGAVLKGEVQKLKELLQNADEKEMNKFVDGFKNAKVKTKEFGELDSSLFILNYKAKDEFVISTDNNVTLVLDITLDKELMFEGAYRELVRTAQVLRKEADFNIEDRIEMDVVSVSDFIKTIVKKFGERIKQEVLIKELNGGISYPDIEKEVEVGDEKVILKLKRIQK
ncbi:MAG: isoleucine--tRNA ligase [Clostridia bacterium]|nr:isoleucine--tRNA ligase [Clostridia bacterium]